MANKSDSNDSSSKMPNHDASDDDLQAIPKRSARKLNEYLFKHRSKNNTGDQPPVNFIRAENDSINLESRGKRFLKYLRARADAVLGYKNNLFERNMIATADDPLVDECRNLFKQYYKTRTGHDYEHNIHERDFL